MNGTIGERLREERHRLGHAQNAFSEIAGVGRRTQHNYESGERLPDAEYLAKIASAGVDVVWVLTGFRGPDVDRPRGPLAPPVNQELLRACVEAVEVALESRGLQLAAEHRVRLYWGVYELSLPTGKFNAAAVEPLLNVIEPRK